MSAIRGVKLLRLRRDGSWWSLNGEMCYPLNEWVTVPGNGAYVALTGGLLAAGDDNVRHVAAHIFECRKPVFRDFVPRGVKCFRQVRMLPDDATSAALTLCKKAVRRRAYKLRYVPYSLRTESLCLTAVRQNAEALHYVPPVLRAQVKAAIKMEAKG